MSSKLIIRSCGSSIRTLIHRHLRPAVGVTNIPTETPGSIYNWHYLLPNSFVPQMVSLGGGFSRDAAGYMMVEEAARGRRKIELDEEKATDEESSSEDDIEDESDDPEHEWPVSDIDNDGDDDYYEDDDR